MPESETNDVISVLGLEDDGVRADRGMLKKPQEWRLGRSDIPAEVLRERMTEFLDSMRLIIARLPDGPGDFTLDQVTISAEVSAKGKVSLLGSGGEVAGKAGLTFTFTRRNATNEATAERPPP